MLTYQKSKVNQYTSSRSIHIIMAAKAALIQCHKQRVHRAARKQQVPCRPHRIGSRKGCQTRKRERRSVEQIYNALGPQYFRRAYRMSYQSFWKLYNEILPYLIKVAGYPDDEKSFYVHNGKIALSVRLACAIRYFAGGSPYDILCKYGIGRSDVYTSVWTVVDAINMHPGFAIEYPSSRSKQEEIARGFKRISGAGFDCCAGAIDGILIWTHRPTASDCKKTGCDAMKFLCGRKEKYGLNCQAVCDARGRFLDMSIIFPGSTSDCLAFEGSSLFRRLENGLLADGLCLFGDNAYINAIFMATPYTGRVSQAHDSYNFHHSQLRIRIECAFGMFTQRWGILRSAMPKGITVAKTTAMVFAMAKLHNFCIDEVESAHNIPGNLALDERNLESRGGVGAIQLETVEMSGDQVIPRALLNGGNHFDDIDMNSRRRYGRQQRLDTLPRERMLNDISNSGLERPVPVPRRH
jgi:hypothetical protein